MSLIDEANAHFVKAGDLDQKGLTVLADNERAIGNVLLTAYRQIEELSQTVYPSITDVAEIVEQAVNPEPLNVVGISIDPVNEVTNG